LKDRFVSLDTIIHFSPVFDRLREMTEGRDLTLTKFECTWTKDRTSDPRPTIGIASDIVHPLGVVSEMFRQGSVKLISGTGYQGKLSDSAPNVIFDIDTRWVTSDNLPVILKSSYAAPEQKRQVVVHYKQADGQPLIAALDFDISPGTDSLKLFSCKPNGENLVERYSYISKPEDIDTGYPTSILVPDRISAFIGWSARAYLNPSDLTATSKISNLDAAKHIQDSIGQVNDQNSALLLTRKSAFEIFTQQLEARRPSAGLPSPRFTIGD